MLILRKYSKNNKIKNRYIITMGYKSKKINRRRNYKRQSRKSIYGGKVGLQSNNDILITLIFDRGDYLNLYDVESIFSSFNL